VNINKQAPAPVLDNDALSAAKSGRERVVNDVA